MSNTNESRAAAKTALDAYRELPGFNSNDERAALADLLVDLAHYADTIEDDTSGSYELERALDTYHDEVETIVEDHDDDEEVDDDICTTCGADLTDNEGYDGLCGECADMAADEYDDEDIPVTHLSAEDLKHLNDQ